MKRLNPFTSRVNNGVYPVSRGYIFVISGWAGVRKVRHLIPRLVLTFECVDEIPRCDQSNETSLLELSYGAICFSALYQMKFGNVVKFWLNPLLRGAVKRLFFSNVTTLFWVRSVKRIDLMEKREKNSNFVPVPRFLVHSFGVTVPLPLRLYNVMFSVRRT